MVVLFAHLCDLFILVRTYACLTCASSLFVLYLRMFVSYLNLRMIVVCLYLHMWLISTCSCACLLCELMCMLAVRARRATQNVKQSREFFFSFFLLLLLWHRVARGVVNHAKKGDYENAIKYYLQVTNYHLKGVQWMDSHFIMRNKRVVHILSGVLIGACVTPMCDARVNSPTWLSINTMNMHAFNKKTN